MDGTGRVLAAYVELLLDTVRSLVETQKLMLDFEQNVPGCSEARIDGGSMGAET